MLLTGLAAGPALEYLLYEAVKAFLMTPYAIAVHRFIILGEKTMSYRIAPAEARFRRFFGWSLALLMLASAPVAIFETLFEPGPTPFVILVVLSIAAMVVGIRAIVLFPAVAVDAPGANWRQAMADTKGYAWRIFLIIAVATLTFLIFVFAVMVAAVGAILAYSIAGGAVITFNAGDAMKALEDLKAGFPRAAYLAIVELVGYTLAVVIASRLYQWIGVRVKGRP